MQKLIPLTMIILMVISLVSTIPNLYTQVVLPPKVVKFEIDKTSIYAGYNT